MVNHASKNLCKPLKKFKGKKKDNWMRLNENSWHNWKTAPEYNGHMHRYALDVENGGGEI